MQVFNTPQKMMKYIDGSYRFVYNNKISIGQEVFVGKNYEGKDIIKNVTEIFEERLSIGDFGNNNVPFSYRLNAD